MADLNPRNHPDSGRVPEKENVPPGTAKTQEADRGRQADAPTQLPKKGWWDVLWRTKQQLDEDNLSVVAAGVAFYGFVAVVPTLAVVIAIYALIANGQDISRHLDLLERVLPGEVMPLIQDQVTRIASDNTAAGISAILGILIALYSSANATKALITGLNICYDETEKRGFIRLNLVALCLTIAAAIGAVASLALVAVLPAVLGNLGLSSTSETLISWLRWPILLGLFMAGVAVVYRFAPSRDKAKWRWITPGAIIAGMLWLVGSGIFSIYVTKFGSYDKTYGSLGAVVVFLMWFYLTAYVVLLGAEFNSEMERQTSRDTTEGTEKELGQRGAYAADTVGPSKAQAGNNKG